MADGDHPEAHDGGDEPVNPFAGMPMFAEMARALEGQGPLNWDAARQFALLGATEGQPEINVDPTVRIAYNDLARIASLHVGDVTGGDVDDDEPELVNRSQWAATTLDDYRPLLTDLATSLGQRPDAPGTTDAAADPMMSMMAGLSSMMGPAMMGMSVGSMVGQLSRRVFGVHDLPIPRPHDRLLLVAANIDQFASDWDIEIEQMRLWVLAHELTGRQLFGVPAIRDGVAALVRRHVSGFRPDPEALTESLGSMDMFTGDADPMAALQQMFNDPEVLLGAVRSPEQLELQPRLDAAVAAVVGYTDWVVDAVAVRLVGGEALRIAEAVRRQRHEPTPDDVFVERLLGIRVGDDQVSRGKAFIQGVVDRVGEHELGALIRRPDALPTPSEIEAPGLWIARITGE